MPKTYLHGLIIGLAALALAAPTLIAAPLAISTGPNLGTNTIGQLQTQLNATGGSGTYTWSLASGSLPTGMNLGTIAGSSPAQAGLIGVATVPGSYAFSLTVNDGSSSVTQAFTWKITALVLKDINLPDAFVNSAYSYTFTALNNAGAVTYTVNSSPALPAGLSLSSAGVLSGTPTTPGAYNINFSIFDGVDTVYRGYQLLIYAVNITTPGALPTVTQGSYYSAQLSAAGGAGGYQYSLTGGSSLPFGLTLQSSGLISGTTNYGPGLYWFYATVTDSLHNSYQKTMSIVIVSNTVAQNRISAGPFDDAVVGNTYGWQIPICCGGTPPYTWSATGLPTGMSIRTGSGITSDYIAPGYGEIWGLATTPGTYNVTLTVTDSLGAAASLSFPFHVSVLTLAPYYNLQSGTLNTPYSQTFEILGGSPSYSVTQIVGPNQSLPNGLTLNTASAASGSFSVTGTPLENGNFDPALLVTDGHGNTLTRNNYFTINNASGGITINGNGNLGTVTTGGNYSNQLSACCVTNYVWSVASGNLPTGLNLSSSGLLSGTATTAGAYTFLVKAADAAGVSPAGYREFTLVVTPMRITTNSLPYGNAGTAYSATFAATGGTGTLTWSVPFGNYLPPGLTLASNGTIGGTPTASGSYYFEVTVTDQSNHIAVAYYGINIYAAGTLPPISFTTGPNFGTAHPGTAWFALGANGGNGTYTWSMVSGTLPPGLALRTDVPSFFSANQQAAIIGVATTPGTYSFTLSVTSAGQSASQTYTVKISALDLQDATPPDGFVNTPFTYTFTPIANAGPVTFSVNGNSTNGAMPPGLTLSSAGKLSGTPITAGIYTIAMNIFDGVDTQYEQYTLYIYAIDITTPGLLPNGTQFESYSAAVAASGGAGDYTFTASGLPAGLTLSSGGTISGTITQGPGLYGFNLTVTDMNQVSYSKHMAIDVIGLPVAPMRITNLTFNDATLGDHYGNTQNICCGGTAPFTWTVSGLPAGLTWEYSTNSFNQYGSTPGDIQIYGVPQKTGTFNVTYTVTDATGATTSATVPINVGVLDVALPSNYGAYGLPNGTIDVPYTATFRVLGGTGPYSFTKTVYGELPDGLSITSNTLTVSGTPLENGSSFNAPAFLFADSAGNTLFRYEGISISGGSSTISVNQNGFFGYNLGSAALGVSYSTTFSACCVSSYTWSVASGSSLPPGLSLSASGTLSGTPTTAGTYTFLVSVADASNASNVGVRSFTLVVTPIAITTSSLPFGTVGTAYSTSLAATGNTGTLTWTQIFGAVSYPPPGLTLASNGTISGTPTTAGAYLIYAQATDGSGNIAIRSYVINVYVTVPPLGLNNGPNLCSACTLGYVNFQLSASGGTPPYHFSFTPGAMAITNFRVQDGPPLPTNYSSTITGSLLGVATSSGTFTSSLRVTDSTGTTFDKPIYFTISPVELLTPSTPPKANAGSPYSFQFVASGGSGSYVWTATGLNGSGLTLSSTGLLSGSSPVAGTYNITVDIADAAVPSVVPGFGYTITVNPFAITDSGILPQGTVNSSYSHQFSAPNCGTGCAWTVFSGSVPSGMMLTSAGLLSGTYTSTGGYFGTFGIQAAGSGGTVQKYFTLNIPPTYMQGLAVTTSIATTLAVANTTLTTLSASGGMPPYTWSVTAGSLPTGITIQGPGDTVYINGAPGMYYLAGRAVQQGTYNFTVQAKDSVGNTATKAFTWIVSNMFLDYTNFPISGNPLILGTSYTQPMLMVGGTGNYTSFTTAAPVYPGLSVSSTTGTISGTPTNTGSQTTLWTVTDSGGDVAMTNVSINASSNSATEISINGGPGLNSVFPQGQSTFYTITANGGTAPYIIAASGSLPPGVALLNGSQLGNGTAATAYSLYVYPTTPGAWTFTLQATDANGATGDRTYTIIVPGFSSPVNTSLPDGAAGVAYSRLVVDYDTTTTAAWTLAAGAAVPPGLTFSSAGVLSGTPTAAGFYAFQAIRADAAGSVTYTISIHISAFGITNSLTLPTAVTGVTYTTANPLVTMTASGGSGLTWSATNLPPGLSISSSGVITGSTTAYATRYAPVITVTNGVTPTSQGFVMFVETPNPTELDYSTSATTLPDAVMGHGYGQGLIPDGGVPPYTLSVASGSVLPPGLSLLAGANLPSNAVPGATQLDGVPSQAGQYTFNIIFADSTGAQITRTFTLNVTPVNLYTSSVNSATTGVDYSQQLAAFGGTPPYTFTLSPTGLVQDILPPGLTLSSSGLLSGTPTGTGSFSAILKVQDSAGHTYATTLSITSNNANGLRINASNIESAAGVSFGGFTLAASGTSTYTWSIVSGALPTGLTLNPAGSLSGWASAAGVFHFTLRATDTNNSSNFADRLLTYTISPLELVQPAQSSFTSQVLPAGAIGTPYSYTFKMAGGTPPYSFTQSPFIPLPAGLSLSSAGVLSGTPTQSGNFNIRPVVTDANGVRYINSTMALVITPTGGKPPLITRGNQGGNQPSLGVPFAIQLDWWVTGGVPPYTWTVTSGSGPAGIAIVNGANGLPSYLSGTPAAAGPIGSFTLTATDSSGQSLAFPIGGDGSGISPLSLTPAELPTGITGSFYSVTFSAAGGTAPYSLVLDPTSNLPPGLSLNNGVLSGTPLYPGVFTLVLDLTDGAGNTLNRTYDVALDTPLGEAPMISASPNPINIYYTQGSAAPSIPVAVTSTSGNPAFAAGVLGINGASLSATSGTTNGSVTLNIPGTLAAGSYSGVISVQSGNAANSGDAIPVTLTVAPAPPCTYSLNPSGNTIPISGGTGSFTIATSPNCSWMATVSDPTLIAITSATSGVGQATINYTVPANTGLNQLNGTISIGGQTYSISQFGQTCSFSISPSSFTTVAAGGQAPIAITSSDASCPWTASGLGATPASGTGSGSVTVTIPQNTTATNQSLSASIAGQTLNITQTGVQCQVTLPATSTAALVSGGPGSIAVTIPSGCMYTTVPGPSWITITSGGSGSASGSLIYNVDPNSTTATRSGFLTIGGVPYQVTQAGIACSITLDTSGLGSPFATAGGTGTININANGANCPWTASSGSSFATVSPASGTGSGSVTVTAGSNAASTNTRTGSLSIAGQAVTFMQGGTTCAYMLRSLGASVPSAGGLGSVGVVAPAACTWTATSNNPSWLSIIPSTTGGTATIQFVALPNMTGTPQIGTLTVAGQTFTVAEAPAPCTYSLSSGSANVGSPGAMNSTLTVTATRSGCNASTAGVTSYANWIGASNSGGTVTYSVAANPNGTTRQGTVQIGDQIFTVSESGAACAYSLASYGAAFGQMGGIGNVVGSPSAQGCTPTVGTTVPSVITLGTISGPTLDIFTQPYSVNVFNSLTNAIRRATITFGGQIYTIKQTSW